MADEGIDEVDGRIGREGRSWRGAEAFSKLDRLPAKLEMVDGKLCFDDEQRHRLLAALLENIGLDEVVKVGSPMLWQQAIAGRLRTMNVDAASAEEGEGSRAADSEPPQPKDSSASVDLVPKEPERHWNYRVMSFESKAGDHWSALHEVHYNRGRPMAYSETPANVLWDTDDGLPGAIAILGRMRAALDKPVLTEADFGASAEGPEQQDADEQDTVEVNTRGGAS